MTLPDSTTPQPEDAPLEAEIPGFAQPTRPSLDPLDPSTTTTTDLHPSSTTDQHHDDEDLGDELREDEHRQQYEPTSPKPEAPSRPSAGDPGVADAAAGLFGLAAVLAGVVLDGTLGHRSGAYRMHPDEAQAIATPLGRMAARRATVSGAEAKDLSDGIQAGVATAAYAARATMQHFAAPDTEATQ